ncbi:hypothetical protein [Nitrosospira sp. Nsp13]|uniref:hypothetical protein n=1 Tax=Nitrosospira sp. Nsp13 TaxID=1855332 RepID=UPI0015860887|nr:hypothetical protein [Nitrosospira sp. Nsp13]
MQRDLGSRSQDVTECDHGVASEWNGDQLEVVKALQKNTRTRKHSGRPKLIRWQKMEIN